MAGRIIASGSKFGQSFGNSGSSTVSSSVSSMSGSRFSKQAVEVSETASKRLKTLIDQKRDNPPLGIRLGVKKRGCSGLSYTLDYCMQQKPTDEVVSSNGVKVFIEPQALMSVIGTKMDFVEDALKSEFVFVNPNAKSLCGCGESFNVQ